MKEFIGLKGKYVVTLNFNVPMWGAVELNYFQQNNEITDNGKEFILTRLYKNNPDPIKYIRILKNTSEVIKEVKKIVPSKSSLEFQADFTNDEMEGAEQIGLTNVSAPVNSLTKSDLGTSLSKLPDGTTITIKYTLYTS